MTETLTRERLTEVLDLVETELREGMKAVSVCDLPTLERHTALLASLCNELRCVAAGYEPALVNGTTGKELRVLAKNVAKGCATYSGLLRKSRRTVNVLSNVLALASVAYKPQGTHSSFAGNSRL